MFRQFSDFFQQALNTASKESNAERLQEINDLNDVYKTRALALQKMWTHDWKNLLDSAKPMANVNELPNFAQHYSTLFNLSEKQVAKQIEEYNELLENTLSSYTYWLAKQIQQEYLY